MTVTTALIFGAALILAGLGGWPLTSGVLRLAARSPDAGTADDAERPGGDGPTGPRAQQVLRGGTWIGVLERTAVAGAVLAGYPAGIAFVIAVKGLGRYPELREHPGSSERFVIGTLASLVWATAVSGVGRALLTALAPG